MRLNRVSSLCLAALAALSFAAVPAEARKHHRSYSDYSNQGPVNEDEAPASAEYERRRPSGDDGGSYMSGGRNVPGKFDYYALVLSWSPTFCSDGSHDDNPQCSGSRPASRPYNFVLHGLWPQYDRGWPQDCRTARDPYVPRPLIDRMLDIMPAPKLVIHEYKKHGTCSGLDPERYYAFARRLFTAVNIPDRFKDPETTQYVSPDEVVNEFVKANPGLKEDAIAVSCGGSGNRMKEVHICLNRQGDYTSCGGNESKRKMCDAPSMTVPPVRVSSFAPATAKRRNFGGAIMEYFGKR